jgi:hypothetical protein
MYHNWKRDNFHQGPMEDKKKSTFIGFCLSWPTKVNPEPLTSIGLG